MFTKRHVPGSIEVSSPITGEKIWVGYYPDLFDNNYKLNVNCNLVKVYPELLNIKIIEKESDNMLAAGYYQTNKKEIVLYNTNKKEVSATLTHELQHALQHIDSRSNGSSLERYYFKVNYFYGDKDAAESLREAPTLYLIDKEEKELYKIAGQVLDNYRELEKYYNKDMLWLSKLANNCYLASVGEIEARTAEQIYLNKGTNFNLVEDYKSGYLNSQVVGQLSISFLSEEFKFDTSLNVKFHHLVSLLHSRRAARVEYLNSFMKVTDEEREEITLEDSLDLIEEHYLTRFGDAYHQRVQRPRTNFTKGRKPAKA